MKLYDISVIKPLMERHGFHFSKALGQNFLIQEWVPKRIAQVSGLNDACGVLEIGPGIGVLTQELCTLAHKVVSVELDKALLPVLDETLSGFDNVEIINQDILKLDISALLDEKFSGLKPMACANLPYNITTPVLRVLLELERFEQITVMIQKEVAQRICAKPGTSDYGAFTLLVNYYAEPKICFDVTPDCFIPQPKVTSSVITLKRIAPPADLISKEMLFSLTRGAFAQRRKTLVNGLCGQFGSRFTKEQITDIITSCGFDALVRGETLGLPEYVQLANAFSNAVS